MSGYQAVTFEPSSPEAEYYGWIIVAYTQNLRADIIRPVLAKHGLTEVDPHAVYLQRDILVLLKEIAANFTFEELVAVGLKTAELLPLPPEINSLEAVVMAVPMLYKAAVRNIPDEEGVVIEKLNPTHYRLHGNSPLPAFMLYAIVYGLIQRGKQKGQEPFVQLTQQTPPVIIEVRW